MLDPKIMKAAYVAGSDWASALAVGSVFHGALGEGKQRYPRRYALFFMDGALAVFAKFKMSISTDDGLVITAISRTPPETPIASVKARDDWGYAIERS